MHDRRIYALGLGVLLVLSSVAPVASAAASSATASADEERRPASQTTQASAENGTMSALEAMVLVRNETTGTVVGVRRGAANATDGNATPVYRVFVLQGNQTGENGTEVDRQLLAVTVDAANRTILDTEQRSRSGEVVEEDQQVLPSESINLSTTRSAIKATRIGVNQSANVTVDEVRLQLTDNNTSPLAYVISVENADGSRVNILVAARRGQGGVIAVEPQDD